MAVPDVNRGRGGGGSLRAADEQLRFPMFRWSAREAAAEDDREKVSKACESRVLPRRPYCSHPAPLVCLGCSVFPMYGG